MRAAALPPVPLHTFVIAGNAGQFRQYRERRGTQLPRDARYVQRASCLTGLRNARFIVTGTFWNHRDWHEIARQIDMLATCFGSSIVYDAY